MRITSGAAPTETANDDRASLDSANRAPANNDGETHKSNLHRGIEVTLE